MNDSDELTREWVSETLLELDEYIEAEENITPNEKIALQAKEGFSGVNKLDYRWVEFSGITAKEIKDHIEEYLQYSFEKCIEEKDDEEDYNRNYSTVFQP